MWSKKKFKEVCQTGMLDCMIQTSKKLNGQHTTYVPTKSSRTFLPTTCSKIRTKQKKIQTNTK